MNAPGKHQEAQTRWFGSTFVGWGFDYLLIGGGLSLITTCLVLWNPGIEPLTDAAWLPQSARSFLRSAADLIQNPTAPENIAALSYFILLSNNCHFAASTVRLYSKPDSIRSLPFLTLMFPFVVILVLTVCIQWANQLANPLVALYMTWSPYHYAAQAYGLAVMYSYRSGCLIGDSDKKLLWWVSMIPFIYTFLLGKDVGLQWLIPERMAALHAATGSMMIGMRYAFTAVAFMAPTLLFIRIWRSSSGPMPILALLPIVANGIWFFVLATRNAFAWATIFHGIQYLAIVIVFHVKDQMARPTNRHGRLFHVVSFYAACLLLGYAVFKCVPYAYVFAGFGMVESVLVVAAVINVHHFIVDAYIWRLKKTDGNRTIVDSTAAVGKTAVTT